MSSCSPSSDRPMDLNAHFSVPLPIHPPFLLLSFTMKVTEKIAAAEREGKTWYVLRACRGEIDRGGGLTRLSTFGSMLQVLVRVLSSQDSPGSSELVRSHREDETPRTDFCGCDMVSSKRERRKGVAHVQWPSCHSPTRAHPSLPPCVPFLVSPLTGMLEDDHRTSRPRSSRFARVISDSRR